MSASDPVDPDIPSYSTAYVARRLGVSVPTVQRWVDAGHLKAWKTVGGHRRIDAGSADALFRSQAVTTGHAPAAPAAATKPVAPASRALRAVVVDDDAGDRELLVALVEAALPGVEVTAVENGFLGLVAIGRLAPDVVVTDIVMPQMDGLAMLGQLAELPEVRPRALVAVTSESPSDLVRRGGLPAGVGYLRKPLDPAALAALLQQALA